METYLQRSWNTSNKRDSDEILRNGVRIVKKECNLKFRLESHDLWRNLANRWNGAERNVPAGVHILQLSLRKYDTNINPITGTAGWEVNKVWVLKTIPSITSADSVRHFKPWAVDIGADLGVKT
jgi:hypothetical protein